MKKNNDTTHLPLESCYLGRSALKILTGDIPNPPKCFSLIRKAKSARVRQDLLEKSTTFADCKFIFIASVYSLGAQTSKTKKPSDFPCMASTRRVNDEPRKKSSIASKRNSRSPSFSFVLFGDQCNTKTDQSRLSQTEHNQFDNRYYGYTAFQHASRSSSQGNAEKICHVKETS